MTIINILLPIATVSEANKREHWALKHKRISYQKQLTYILLRNRIKELGIGISKKPVKITCIRHGKRMLDDDNLASAFKAIIDGVASVFEMNDKDIRMFFEQTNKNDDPYTELNIELEN